MTWKALPSELPDLTTARLQLHFSIQPAASAQVALASHQPDYSHTSLLFDPNNGNFLGRDCTTPSGPVRPYLHLETLTLGLHGQSGDVIDSIQLTGKTMAEALEWMSSALNNQGASVNLTFPEYPDFPESELRTSATFITDFDQIRLLANLYHNSHQALGANVATQSGASEIRTWPHHFDMACLVELPEIGKDASVGAGFSPGDEGTPEPYWYVSPWPYPPTDNLPDLPKPASWNTDGWVGAVLKSSDLLKEDQPAKVLNDYLTAAFKAAKHQLVGSTG